MGYPAAVSMKITCRKLNGKKLSAIKCGGIYPSYIEDMDGLIETLEEYISDILHVSSMDIKIHDVEVIQDSVHGNSYSFTIDVADIVTEFINETNTPLAYKLDKDGYLYVNTYSDIAVEHGGSKGGKYYNGVALDCYSDVPYEVDMEQLDAESDFIGNGIISILAQHKDKILDICIAYVGPDEDDFFEDDFEDDELN